MDDDKTAILSTSMHNIEKLIVKGCNLTTGGLEHICNAIKALSVPVNIQHIASTLQYIKFKFGGEVKISIDQYNISGRR